MLLGLGAVAISTLLATIIGILSGYYGGRIDIVLQRCIDTLMAFPGLVVLLTIMAMLGQGLGNVILALGIGGPPATRGSSGARSSPSARTSTSRWPGRPAARTGR